MIRRLRWYAIGIDIVAVTTALLAARLIRNSDQVPALITVPQIPSETIFWLVLVWFVALPLAGAYDRNVTLAGFELYRRIFVADSFALIIVVAVTYFREQTYISRGFLLFAWLLVLLFVSLGRLTLRQHIYGLAARGHRLNRVIMVGANRHGVAIAEQLVQARSASTTVIGFLDDFRPLGSEILPGIRVIGDPMKLLDIAAEKNATHAVVVESGISWESHQWLVTHPAPRGALVTLMAPGLFDLTATKVDLRQLGSVPLLLPRSAAISGLDAVLKRTFDIVAALALLIVTLPLQVIIALRLWPKVFQLRRVLAYGGRELRLLEFRPRARMRQFHMSRLPSLIHVLSGSLSLVGPRPLEAHDSEQYAAWMSVLRSAKPGFIGPWWLVGLGRPENLEEEIMLDLHYLRNYTVWFDLHVLAQTARLLLQGSAWEVPTTSANPASSSAEVRS
jgi:lipopolysaccharide/colanic/teichoic acid biosynthesis glycosyltransferase